MKNNGNPTWCFHGVITLNNTDYICIKPLLKPINDSIDYINKANETNIGMYDSHYIEADKSSIYYIISLNGNGQFIWY